MQEALTNTNKHKRTMPAIKRQITAATENALTNLRFTRPKRPTLVSLWASSATAGEDLSFSVDDLVVADSCEINLEAANQVIDVQRDQILFREPCPAGEYVLAVPAVAADMSYQLNIETVG